MQKKVKLNFYSGIAIVFLLILIVLVRVFQHELFYDPLLDFFKSESKILPEYNSLKLFAGLLFRYVLNMVFSLGIIYLVFKDKAILKLCAMLYTLLFIVLIILFFIVLTADNKNLLLLFYIRRFLIQPLFLILFLPAFYYQKRLRR